MNDDLMKKLMVAKAIMDKQDQKPRGQYNDLTNPIVENFDVPQGRYNIPSEILNVPNNLTEKMQTVPNIDAIKNSKLPDPVKKLMMEHPIQQQQINSGAVLSDELIEKASKLMGTKQKEQPRPEQKNDLSDIKRMIEEAVNNALKANGLISESVDKSDEVFSFRVGKHVFEGKITKIKKMK